MSLSRKNTPPGYHPVWSNFSLIFSANFKLIAFFVPSLLSLLCFLYLGGLVFLLAALLLLLPAGPAIAAVYDMGYRLNMGANGSEPRKFMHSYKMNLKQGIAAMAMHLPFLATIVLVMVAPVQRPMWLNLWMLLSGILLMAFSILTFSQIALIEMPLGRILKNAVFLIPVSTWRSLLPALVQVVFIALLFLLFQILVMLFVFAGPALLIVWSCKLLWPVMDEQIREISE